MFHVFNLIGEVQFEKYHFGKFVYKFFFNKFHFSKVLNFNK